MSYNIIMNIEPEDTYLKKVGLELMFLTEDKYKQLTEVGFIWDALSFDYDKFYNELMTYKEKHGNLLVLGMYENKETTVPEVVEAFFGHIDEVDNDLVITYIFEIMAHQALVVFHISNHKFF